MIYIARISFAWANKHSASASDKQLKTSYNKYQQAVKALILSAFYCIRPFPSSLVEPVSTYFLPLF